MTNEVVKGMERARHEAYWSSTASAGVTMEEEAMRAALIWLAENVTNEMVNASWKFSGLADVSIALLDVALPDHRERHKALIAAAIRKAAEG